MKINAVYLGSWFPKTELHLNEFYAFLTEKKVMDLLEDKTAAKHYAILKPKDVIHDVKSDIHNLKAHSGEFEYTYFEDGLLVVKKEFKDLKKDIKKSYEFYNDKLSSSLSYLFSTGAKGLDIIRVRGGRKKIFICGSARHEKEVSDLFQKLSVRSYDKTEFDNFDLYQCSKAVFVNVKNEKKLDINLLIQYLILFDEINKHFKRLLYIHRYIWDKSEKRIMETKVSIKILPTISEELTEYANTIANISNRIDQMRLIFDFRNKNMPQAFEKYRGYLNFDSADQKFSYIKNLFEMSSIHLENNINELRSIYRENQQKSLNRLQMLFLISVVTSFLTLGAFPSADIVMYDSQGQMISFGNFISFSLGTLLKFGSITLALTCVLYYLWEFIFKSYKPRIKK